MAEKLKPCPFCGEKASYKDVGFLFNKEHAYVVNCSACGCTTPLYLDLIEAIKCWNKRVIVAKAKKQFAKKDCGKFVEETDESGNYSIKCTTCFKFENILSFIMAKKEIYERLFHEQPNYIKMPMWAYRRAIKETVFPKYDLICGLIPCPTNSIQSIDEIEVF